MCIRFLPTALLLAILAACSGDIYLHDGVTDGDTFYLAPHALADVDPALQSWVTYSLTRSTCQLQLDGENPARTNSFDCELTARRLLLDSWHEKRATNPEIADAYLNDLSLVQQAGFLPEYVARYFAKSQWRVPDDVRKPEFRSWQRNHLPGHKPVTILTGSWNYSRRISNYQHPTR